MAALSRHFVVIEEEDGRLLPEASVVFKAIMATSDPSALATLEAAGARIRGRVGRVVSLEAPLGAAGELARSPSLLRLDLARRMRPELNKSAPEINAPDVWDTDGGFGARGAGVLVAILDSGQDLRHPDFRIPDNKMRTRFKSVYNMAGGCKGIPPPGHAEGCYYDQQQIDKFLDGNASLTYSDPPVLGGHGTHVAGIAAGNGRAALPGTKKGVFVGIAPKASLLGVKLYNDKGYFVGDITEALQYLAEEQVRQGNLPLVVNLSLGHHDGAHDGTDADEMAIDAFIDEGTTNGTPRVVVKSAGNGADEDVHVGGTAGTGATASHFFEVPGGGACTPFSGRGNDLFEANLWYEGDVEITVTITAPGGTSAFSNATGNPSGFVGVDTPKGTIFVDCPAAPDSLNSSRECQIGVDDTGGIAPARGTWTVEIDGVDIPMSATGRYDAWVTLVGRGNCTWGWDAATPEYSVSIPGTSLKGLTVGAYVTKASWTNIDGVRYGWRPKPTLLDLAEFSSRGPTRDGRIKPDLVAPGMLVAAARPGNLPIPANSTNRALTTSDGKHIHNLGTSMSAPHVTGAAALLLSIDPTLTEAEIRSLLLSSASDDGIPAAVVLPDNSWGAGRLDVRAAAEAIP